MAPSKQVYTAVPQFHALYESWKATQQFDGFCKLYVALTRARRACHIILPGREGKGELRTESMWKIIRSAALTASCGTEDTLPESGAECLYSRGEPEWYAELPEKDTRTEPENAPEWARSQAASQAARLPLRTERGKRPFPQHARCRPAGIGRIRVRRPCRF